jgi:hypothetical protein
METKCRSAIAAMETATAQTFNDFEALFIGGLLEHAGAKPVEKLSFV